MKHIDIEITGVTPLLMNSFTDADQQAATEGNRSSAAAADRGTAKEQAAARLYLGTDGKVVIPQPNIFSCLIEAGKFFKAGKSKITTQKTSLLPACIFFTETEFLLNHKEDWAVDTRPVRIPATGGRILKHRPSFERWSVDFDVDLDTTELSEKLFREIVDAAGNKVGLCDYRPACKGPFGRFKVTKWIASEPMALAA